MLPSPKEFIARARVIENGDSHFQPHRIDGREAEEIVFDALKELHQLLGVDEGGVEHCLEVGLVLGAAALELGQRLRVRIEVTHRQSALLGDGWAPVLLAHQREHARRISWGPLQLR